MYPPSFSFAQNPEGEKRSSDLSGPLRSKVGVLPKCIQSGPARYGLGRQKEGAWDYRSTNGVTFQAYLGRMKQKTK
jgi:hypothetical protein